METFSALLGICAGNSPVPGEFPAQRSVTRSFDVFLICFWINAWVNNREAGDLRRYRAPLWRHSNVYATGGELHNGFNGLLKSFATDSVRFLQLILDREHTGDEWVQKMTSIICNHRFMEANTIHNIA